jgi:hypothetical protein
MTRVKPYFRTFTGRRVHPLDPMPDEINIFDVARALSHQCRFLGHTSVFYSVAQHSVLVSHLVPTKDALWGLVHDASEAFLGDLPSPIKRDPEMASYRVAEDRLMWAVCERYDLPPEMPASVRQADRVMLATEFRDITGVADREWIKKECGVEPLPHHIEAWLPAVAEAQFMDRFVEVAR